MKKLLIILSLVLVLPLMAQEKVQKFDWNGIEVVWLQDQNFPTYDFVVYFADGALGDKIGSETDTMFNLLTSGTRRFDQKDINDNLDFFGVDRSSEVTHEYSTYHVSGLVKDIKPTMKMICHLFDDATFPDQELSRYKTIRKERLTNLISSQGALAGRSFRSLSMAQTPFANPSSGRLKDFDGIASSTLKAKLNYFKDKVSKKIYITGPRQVLDIKEIILNECGWSKGGFVRKSESFVKKFDKNPVIHLVTVPQATQSYIMVGRFLNKSEIKKLENLELLSGFLGGGFSSKLMKEIRVKRGLSYGADASASGQRDYGRLVISTYTKNASVSETLSVIKSSLDETIKGRFEDKDLEITRDGLVGSYPFRFEKSSAYLDQLIYFDHIGRDYSEIYSFPESVKKISKGTLVETAESLLDWNQLTVMVLGPKELAEKLKAFGEVKISQYDDYL